LFSAAGAWRESAGVGTPTARSTTRTARPGKGMPLRGHNPDAGQRSRRPGAGGGH
jgi:hypothetical protein